MARLVGGAYEGTLATPEDFQLFMALLDSDCLGRRARHGVPVDAREVLPTLKTLMHRPGIKQHRTRVFQKKENVSLRTRDVYVINFPNLTKGNWPTSRY